MRLRRYRAQAEPRLVPRPQSDNVQDRIHSDRSRPACRKQSTEGHSQIEIPSPPIDGGPKGKAPAVLTVGASTLVQDRPVAKPSRYSRTGKPLRKDQGGRPPTEAAYSSFLGWTCCCCCMTGCVLSGGRIGARAVSFSSASRVHIRAI
jgi:hypothetical protein